MIWIAIRMLTGDAQKFYGLVFGIAFSTLLITQQLTIFVNLVERGASGVYNVSAADIWVMDEVSRTTDVNFPMPSTALDRVRSVPGVEWAVPHLRAGASVRSGDGDLEGVAIIGVDDATLIGLPKHMIAGNPDVLSQPDSVIIDDVGVTRMFEDGRSPIGAAPRTQRPACGDPRHCRCHPQLHQPGDALYQIQPGACATSRGPAIGCPSCWSVQQRMSLLVGLPHGSNNRPVCGPVRATTSPATA